MSSCWTYSFTTRALEEYQYFAKTNPAIVRRINQLIMDMMLEPKKGLGKPEQLKGNLTGCWSRRITGEHRLVYRIQETEVEILSCRFHYDK